MTEEKKTNPTRRTPRKRGKAKAQTRSPDEAKRNPGHSARDVSDTRASETERDDHATGVPQKPQPARVLAVIPLHVRWRDLDAFNHANNSSYLTYLEESRLQWLRNVPGEWFNEHSMPVMAAVELHYRKPITWPAEIDVLLSCERLGNSSMTIGNRIVARGDAECVYADGNIVMVWIDPTTGTPVPLPAAIRTACAS
jgi:acyl-CoA thioester hydrolase